MERELNNRILKMLSQAGRQSPGTVLIVTIWITLVLASMVIVMSRTLRVDVMSSVNNLSAVQAEATANAAIAYVRARVTSSDDSSVDYSEKPFEDMDSGSGRFWVLRPNLSDDKNHDFGLADEGGKININSASLEMLLKLPSMTSELATAIIDWRDSDSEITAGGAESEYYLLLGESYNCKNAPFETVEEVLFVKGCDHDYLYGEDLNRNGVLDDNENDAQQSLPADNSNGKLEPGFLNYVTVYSKQPNGDRGGESKIDVTSKQIASELSKLIKDAIGDEKYYEVNENIMSSGPYRFQSVIEFYIRSGLSEEDFKKIESKLVAGDDDELPGLVNINTAPKEVLLCLPGLEESDVDSIVAKRADQEDSDSITWLTEVLEDDKVVGIGPYITVTSYQYSADIVALSKDGRSYRRYYVVIDKSEGNAKVVYRKSLTHLGWPLSDELLEDSQERM
ncbi:MAG: general secretion pathway protein GspK [Phycisphaerae bacterium]|nr:general secretion pathway protein GspK [Phycisphaerae bacterium]